MRIVALRQYVWGAIEIARKRSARERFSRGGLHRGGRRVREVSPEDAACLWPPDNRLEVQEDVNRALTILEGFIREYTKREDYRELLRRTYRSNEAQGTIADELAIVGGTARSVVSRFAQHYQLRTK